MVDIHYYLNDGACYKAQAILILLRGLSIDVLEMANKEQCQLNIKVGRYENCREQGYVVSLCDDYKNIANYCFFEHRNVDNIGIISFTAGSFFDTPPVETIWKDKKDKWDVDEWCEDVMTAAEWIISDMQIALENYLDDYAN